MPRDRSLHPRSQDRRWSISEACPTFQEKRRAALASMQETQSFQRWQNYLQANCLRGQK